MKINRLHKMRMIENADPMWVSGRSTGRAMSIIGEAMTNPGEAIRIVDHQPRGHEPLAYRVQSIIQSLDLKFLDISHSSVYYLTYNLFEEIEDENPGQS